MDVLDLLQCSFRLNYVAIVATAPLPEAIVRLSIRLAILHPAQECWRVTPNMQKRSLGHGLLDRIQNVTDVIFQLGWPNEQVSVFRHDDVRPNLEVVLQASALNSFRLLSLLKKA